MESVCRLCWRFIGERTRNFADQSLHRRFLCALSMTFWYVRNWSFVVHFITTSSSSWYQNWHAIGTKEHPWKEKGAPPHWYLQFQYKICGHSQVLCCIKRNLEHQRALQKVKSASFHAWGLQFNCEKHFTLKTIKLPQSTYLVFFLCMTGGLFSIHCNDCQNHRYLHVQSWVCIVTCTAFPPCCITSL